MNITLKHLFFVFVASLPACYWTVVPSVLLFLVLISQDAFVKYENLLLADEAEPMDQAGLEELKKQVAELRSEVNGLNLAKGLGKK